MKQDLKASSSITINASTAEVWDALLDPEKIKSYLFGTKVSSDWEVETPIQFQGEYQGETYLDKGTILEKEPRKLLKYSYLSSMSGLEDRPENYSTVIYKLDKIGEDQTKFTWEQEGFANEEGRRHTEEALPNMLKQIKEISEKS